MKKDCDALSFRLTWIKLPRLISRFRRHRVLEPWHTYQFYYSKFKLLHFSINLNCITAPSSTLVSVVMRMEMSSEPKKRNAWWATCSLGLLECVSVCLSHTWLSSLRKKNHPRLSRLCDIKNNDAILTVFFSCRIFFTLDMISVSLRLYSKSCFRFLPSFLRWSYSNIFVTALQTILLVFMIIMFAELFSVLWVP
jgi:hypothetical protein